MELIVEVVHPQVKLKATCKALTMGARLDFDAILQQTYFALCLWELVWGAFAQGLGRFRDYSGVLSEARRGKRKENALRASKAEQYLP